MSPQTSDLQPRVRSHLSQGMRLNVLEWGAPDAPPLVLLHGMRDHARSWDWTARALCGEWRVIAPDLRGHGDSEWSPDGAYLTSYHLLDMASLFDVLELERFTLVGHSFGGTISARYAGVFPDRVRKLVLVDGLGPAPNALAEWNRQGPAKRTRDWLTRARAAACGHSRRFASIEEAVERMARANPNLTPDQARHLTEHGLRRHADGYAWKYDPLVGVFPPEDFSAETGAVWEEITAPALLCYGPESWTTNPEEDGRASHFRDQRTVVFEGAGHWLHHDRFEDFLTTLRAFI